jgi:hypothetical protein
MPSVLVVCYSSTGTSRRLAQLLCSQRGWPLGEIRDLRHRSALTCVLDSLLRRHPGIRYEGPRPSEFQRVLLISPIWMHRLCGPMRSFIVQFRNDLQQVAVACTMGSGGASNAFAEVGHILGHRPIACATFLQREVDDGSCTARLLEFGEALWLSAPEGTGPGRTQPAAVL